MSSQPPAGQAAGNDQLTWVPDACTLPAADRPLRANEFAEFFGAAVRRIERPERGLLRFELEPRPEFAERAARLAVAETSCCSFFTFTLTVTEAALALAITAPPEHAVVLDAIEAHATVG